MSSSAHVVHTAAEHLISCRELDKNDCGNEKAHAKRAKVLFLVAK